MIPVVDLMSGVVVRAKMGEREAYRPIETPLSHSSDPIAVLRGLLNLAPFSTIYVADLDAIRRRGNNTHSIQRLRRAYPVLHFWIDSGAADMLALNVIRAFGEPVLGSESLNDLNLLKSQHDALLSLDFNGDELLGPPELLANPDIWPNKIIVMTLKRIGAGIGPDWGRLRFVQALAASRQIFAAGGVRGSDDIHALKEFGAAGVLVASALHDGHLQLKDFG